MATIGYTNATLIDMASRYNGTQITPLIEVLSEENEVLADISWVEANGIYAHKFSKRSSLPSGTWRKLNEGVTPTKGTTEPVIAAMASLEAFSYVDKDIVDGAPNPQATRQEQDMAHVEGLSQEFADCLFNGSTTTAPEKFNGLAAILNSTSSTSNNGTANVIGASGTGDDCTSIYVVQWGPNRVQMFYPLGSTAGLQMRDLGLDTVNDSNSKPYLAYRTHFEWKCGLAVYDDRCIQRIANIESAGTSNIFDEDDLITALNRLPAGGRGAVIYCNRTVKTQMDIIAKDKSNVSYTSGEVFGRPTTLFRGVPVRICDAILNTESAIA